MKNLGHWIYLWTTQEFEQKWVVNQDKFITDVTWEITEQMKDRVLLLLPSRENLARKYPNSVVIYDKNTDKVVWNFSKWHYTASDFWLDWVVEEVVDFESFILDRQYRWRWFWTELFKEAVATEKQHTWKLLVTQTLNYRVFRSAKDCWFNLDKTPKIPFDAAVNALQKNGLWLNCVENNLIFMTNSSMLCSKTKRNVEQVLQEQWHVNAAYENFPYRGELLRLSKALLDWEKFDEKTKNRFKWLFSKVWYVMHSWVNKNLYWTDTQFELLANY